MILTTLHIVNAFSKILNQWFSMKNSCGGFIFAVEFDTFLNISKPYSHLSKYFEAVFVRIHYFCSFR